MWACGGNTCQSLCDVPSCWTPATPLAIASFVPVRSVPR